MPETKNATERVRQAYLDLSKAATELNSVSDELSVSVAKLEQKLKVLGLGVPARAELDHWHAGDNAHELYLGYGKCNGKWGVIIVEETKDGRTGALKTSDVWQFRDSPRPYRVAACNKFPDLLDVLCVAAAVLIADLEAAKVQADMAASYLEDIGK